MSFGNRSNNSRRAASPPALGTDADDGDRCFRYAVHEVSPASNSRPSIGGRQGEADGSRTRNDGDLGSTTTSMPLTRPSRLAIHGASPSVSLIGRTSCVCAVARRGPPVITTSTASRVFDRSTVTASDIASHSATRICSTRRAMAGSTHTVEPGGFAPARSPPTSDRSTITVRISARSSTCSSRTECSPRSVRSRSVRPSTNRSSSAPVSTIECRHRSRRLASRSLLHNNSIWCDKAPTRCRRSWPTAATNLLASVLVPSVLRAVRTGVVLTGVVLTGVVLSGVVARDGPGIEHVIALRSVATSRHRVTLLGCPPRPSRWPRIPRMTLIRPTR